MPLPTTTEGGLEPADRDVLRPDPLRRTFHSLALARCVGVVARLGLFTELAATPVEVDELAHRFALQPEPLRTMLDLLTSERLLEYADGGYLIAPKARRWLDPESPQAITTFLSHTLDYWDWWSELDQVAAGGAVAVTKPSAQDEIGWLRRVRGDYEYIRRIGPEFADAVDLPRHALSIVELGSSHGALAEALCRRHPTLRATVIDCAAGVAVGREIMWEANLDGVIEHRAGDALTAALGGPHDAIICTRLARNLDSDEVASVLRRVRAALQPGGLLITLRPSRRRNAPANGFAAATELFHWLASCEDPPSTAQFRDQLTEAGFGIPRVHELASACEFAVYVTRAI